MESALSFSKVSTFYRTPINRNYLYAEYNFVQSAAAMAARWEDFEAGGGDRYNLQYRTMRDDKVRPEHAALDGTTLPPSDPFWDAYYPPNGWNCFTEGTLVLTQSGWRAIESIHKGDLVVGGSGKLRKVIGTHAKLVNEELCGIFAKGTLTTCTKNHRFCTPHGWVSAECLKPGDIIIQVGKTSALYLLVHAIANAYTLLRYGLMANERKRKTVAALTVDNKIKGGNEKINHIASKKFALLKGETQRRQVCTHNSLAFAQRSMDRTHALGVKRTSFKRVTQRLRSYIRAKKRRTDFKFFCYASDKTTVFLRLSLAHMTSFLGKRVVDLRKTFACFCPSFHCINPLGSHGITAMSDSNTTSINNAADGSFVHAPMNGKLSNAALFREIPAFYGIMDIHAFNGFHSFFSFLRCTFFHNRYVLVEGKVTKNKRETIVYNLSVFKDESYIVSTGITHNCRCSVVQVRRSKYPETSSAEANRRGEEALKNDTRGMFRFNAGKMKKTMPDYNPYTIRRCRDCDIAKGKTKLAKFVPENELCQACRLVRSIKETQKKHIDRNRSLYGQLIKDEKYKDVHFDEKNGGLNPHCSKVKLIC